MLELARLNVVEEHGSVWALVAVEKGDEVVDGALTDVSVARPVVVVVERVVHLQIELVRHVVHALQDELQPRVVALLGLVQPAARPTLVHNERRVVCALVAQYVVLEVAYELERVVGEAALQDHEEHVVDLVVDGGQHRAHLVQYVRGVELRAAEADRVDERVALVGARLELERARGGVLAHIEAIATAGALNALGVATAAEQAVADGRLAHPGDAEQHDRLLAPFQGHCQQQ